MWLSLTWDVYNHRKLPLYILRFRNSTQFASRSIVLSTWLPTVKSYTFRNLVLFAAYLVQQGKQVCGLFVASLIHFAAPSRGSCHNQAYHTLWVSLFDSWLDQNRWPTEPGIKFADPPKMAVTKLTAKSNAELCLAELPNMTVSHLTTESDAEFFFKSDAVFCRLSNHSQVQVWHAWC